MGQKLGRQNLLPEAEIFANLSRASITLLWRGFNDIADGFGVSQDELEEICIDLKDELNISKLAIKEKTTALFLLLDTDKNGLVDALEFTSSIAALSGMRLHEIIEFILTSYDFDGTQQLSIDEVTLALKSTAIGLCKMFGAKFPKEETIEHLVSELFRLLSADDSQESYSFRISVLAEALSTHHDICSWYYTFGEPSQVDLVKHELNPHEHDFQQENPTPVIESSLCNEWNIHAKVPKEYSAPGPWRDVVNYITPSAYTNTKMNRFAPDVMFEPTWIYGYQSEKSKNNVRYTSSKGHCIVYHNGRYGIVYSFDSHKQNIFSAHRNEILCLAIHPDGEFIATGDAGDIPTLNIWSSQTMRVAFSERGFHRKGIIHAAFSHDGKQIATVGLDDYNSVAVYLWQKSEMLFSSQVDKGKCLACSFLSDPRCTLAIGGDAYLYLWSKSNEGYLKRRANFSRHTVLQSITCIATLEIKDSFVTGTVTGELLFWVDRNCTRNIKAHQGAVSAIYSCSHGVISGGKDKRIRLWTQRLEPGPTFDMSHFGLQPSIRSVCMSMDGSSILFGTMGAEIYEISAVDGSDLRGGAVTSGHSYGNLWAIATHPKRNEFASVGDDRCLRIWDATTRTLLKVASFDADAKTVSYSPLGDVIAVGLGHNSSDKKARDNNKSGAYVILNEEDLSVIHEAKDSNAQITLVAFSPEGETLVVAAEDGPLYLYAVNDEYELIGRCVRNSGPVYHLDFSVDGEWIRTNSSNGELLYFNTDDASLQSNSAAMRDMQWVTSTCIYSWHAKSIHDNNLVGETIVTACVSQEVLDNDKSGGENSGIPIARSNPNDFIATGTNLGFVCVYPYPCIPHEIEYHRFVAHSGPVATLRFFSDSLMMLTCGKEDRCIIQWKCAVAKQEEALVDELENVAAVETAIEYVESDDYGLEMRGGSDIEEDFMVPDCCLVSGILNSKGSIPNTSKLTDLVTKQGKLFGNKTESMQVWLEGIVEPTNPPSQQVVPPSLTLKLEYVHGYHCQDMRNNLRYTSTDAIAFPCATIGVVMDRLTKAQNFFFGHHQSISSFVCNREGSLIATGEIGYKPQVFIWDGKTCATVGLISDLQAKAVVALAFSNNSELLAVAGLDVDHTITIYNWKQNLVLCRALGGSRRINGICFSDADNELLTCAHKENKVWAISTWSLTSKVLSLTNGGKEQPFISCCYFNSNPVVGTIDGHLYVFENKTLQKAIKAHDGGVHALHVSYNRTMLVTGGKDGMVRIWNNSFDTVKEINTDYLLTNAGLVVVSTRVRSVCFSRDGNFLLVGTRGADIFEIRISNSSLVGSKPLLQGHGSRELWGLASHPTKAEFVTCGDDGTIRVWDIKSFHMTKCIKMDTPARSITYSPDGKLIAVGFGTPGKRSRGKVGKDGAFAIISASDYKLTFEGKDSNEAIKFIKFSVDSKLIAVGSEDGKIYVYNVKDHFSRRCTINCHRAPLMTADFSGDTQFLMSVDITKRICYSETTSGVNIPSAAALRDTKWSTWSSPVGWPVKGFWQFQPFGAEPTCSQRSWSGQLIATGNSSGRIFVSHYPCPDVSGFIGDGGHAGPIAQTSWIAGDGSIITIGAKDNGIFQWKCIYDESRESGDEGGISCDDSEIERDCGCEYLNVKLGIKEEHVSQLWMSNIVAPTIVKDDAMTTPHVGVEPYFVCGIRCGDCRQSIRYNSNGDILYFVSKLGIIYNRKKHHQVIYDQHNSPLICLDVNASGNIVASGESGDNPEIHFWDACTASKLSSISDLHRNGVSAVAFSPCGKMLASLGQDLLHSIVILKSPNARWINDVYVLASINVSLPKMLWIRYIDEDTDYPIIVGGVKAVYFFKVLGKTLEKVKGTFGRKRKLQPILCSSVAYLTLPETNSQPTSLFGGNVDDNDGSATKFDHYFLVTGTTTGHLYIWKSQRVTSKITAHDAPIYCICSLNQKSTGGFITAAKEGLIKIWNMQLQMIHSFNVQTFVPTPFAFSCHSIYCNSNSTKLSIVVKSGELFEICLLTHSCILISESHSYKELHGLCTSPVNEDEFATVGDDGVVRIWSLSKKRCIRRCMLEVAGRAIAWSPDGEHIAVGVGGDPAMNTKDGAIIILSAASPTLDILYEDRKAKFTISDLKYSPDGRILIVTSRDGRFYIHDCLKDVNGQQYKLLIHLELPQKETFATHIDFNLNSTYIRLSTNTSDLLFYALNSHPYNDVQLVSLSSSLRDEVWQTNQCPYAWMTKGVWRPASEGVSVSAMDTLVPSVRDKMPLIAAAYDNGDVSIYNYPCQNYGANFISLRGLSSKSPALRFTSNGEYLITLDALARSIIVYKLSPHVAIQ